jgi:hypothetical protein
MSKRLTKRVILTLDESVLAGNDFLSNTACPIALAAKKHFGKQVSVSTMRVTVYSGLPYVSKTLAMYEIFGSCGKSAYVEHAQRECLTVPVILNMIKIS